MIATQRAAYTAPLHVPVEPDAKKPDILADVRYIYESYRVQAATALWPSGRFSAVSKLQESLPAH